MVATYTIDGLAELEIKLKEIGDPKAILRTLRAGVKAAMQPAMDKARSNLQAISPHRQDLFGTGSKQKRDAHRTYRGRLVSAGFAARSLRMELRAIGRKGIVYAKLGVRREAFYAVQFHELGTSKVPAYPWLRPAFEDSAEEGLQQIGTTMRRRIDRIARQRAAGGTGRKPRGPKGGMGK